MITYSDIILRLVVAATMGSVIGFERELSSWFAGLRTHMLVCVGAALIMIVSQHGFSEVLTLHNVILDPSRVAAQVVSGIGFLGAGTILLWQKVIRGLTTAASLWATAAVGLAVGSGMFFASITTTCLVLFILAGLKPFERSYLKKGQPRGILLSTKPRSLSLSSIENALANVKISLGMVKIQIETKENEELIQLVFKTGTSKNLIDVMEELRKLTGIEAIELLY